MGGGRSVDRYLGYHCSAAVIKRHPTIGIRRLARTASNLAFAFAFAILSQWLAYPASARVQEAQSSAAAARAKIVTPPRWKREPQLADRPLIAPVKTREELCLARLEPRAVELAQLKDRKRSILIRLNLLEREMQAMDYAGQGAGSAQKRRDLDAARAELAAVDQRIRDFMSQWEQAKALCTP